ncbi:zinc-finger double domain-containing protein [Phthorimaea operculella]|nr:zinc-finger double domain-containing protein [Phthorimaea operculella]
MWNIRACIVCFSTECVLYKIDRGPLKQEFHLLSGLKEDETTGMPQYLCVECTAYVKRFRRFRDKCKRSNFAFKELLRTNKQITSYTLEAINRESLKIAPTRSYLDLNKPYYETIKYKWEKDNFNRGTLGAVAIDKSIPVFCISTIAEYDSPNKRVATTKSIKVEIEPQEYEVEIPNGSLNELNNEEYFESNHYDYAVEENDSKEAEGTDLDPEYGTMVPISTKEALAVLEVYKIYGKGKYKCETCNRAFTNQQLYDIHVRMHGQLISGNHQCSICKLFYKTEFVLKTHMTDKHLYKYLCKKCPEVSFDRTTAKKHYASMHIEKTVTGSFDRPPWLKMRGTKGGKRKAKTQTAEKKVFRFPKDFLEYTPVSQEDQYQLVQDRKSTRNYLEAMFKCELCFKGFREAVTYSNHMKKHDPAVSGNLQCDMCKMQFNHPRQVYKHMRLTHLFRFNCAACNYTCYNVNQAQCHYKWHKNVTFTCEFCNKVFRKQSTRLTHIRVKHPSTIICDICGHSFVSDSGLYCHKKYAHTPDEIASSEAMKKDRTDPHYCADCDIQFLSATAFKTHLGSSNKHASTNVSTKPVRLSRPGRITAAKRAAGRPRCGSSDIVNNGLPTATNCEICNEFLSNDVQAKKHYESEHPGADYLKRYMCDVCGHTTRQYANLMVHMRTHTQEKPYECPHCDRRFSMPSNRDRHIVVHTGEKKFQCQHCSRRFTQSSAVKLHIQTVHLKIPYAPWDKKNRKRRKKFQYQHCSRRFTQSSAVKLHIQTVHLKIPYAPWDKKNRKRRKSSAVKLHIQTVHLKIPYAPWDKKNRKRRKHTREKKFQCQHCSRRFTQSSAVKLHIQTVHLKIPYAPWDKKNRKRRKSSAVKLHIQTVHLKIPYAPWDKKNRKRRKCCQFEIHSLSAHVIQHTGEKKFQCQHCSRRFTQSSAVKLHIQTVHLKIPYAPWDKKNRKRRKSSAVKLHIQTVHLKIPYAPWDKKNRKRRKSSAVKLHIQTVHLKIPYAPWDKKNRKRRKHTREQKFQCQHCSRRFTQSSAVKLHIQTVHLKIPYAPWDKKNRKRRKSSAVKLHIQTVHLKIPYAPWDKKNRKRRKSSAVKLHIQTVHLKIPYAPWDKKNRKRRKSSAVKLHIQTVHLKIPYAPWDKKNRKRRKELEGSGMVTAPPLPAVPPQPKLMLDAQGDYLSAYITYND